MQKHKFYLARWSILCLGIDHEMLSLEYKYKLLTSSCEEASQELLSNKSSIHALHEPLATGAEGSVSAIIDLGISRRILNDESAPSNNATLYIIPEAVSDNERYITCVHC